MTAVEAFRDIQIAVRVGRNLVRAPGVTGSQAVLAPRLLDVSVQVVLDHSVIADVGDPDMLVVVAEGWPIVQLGPTGGIVLPQIRSYAKAWDAAMDGKAVFEKQQARDQKKITASAPQPAAEKQTATA